MRLSADRGYLQWHHPKGTLDVMISYGLTGEDFRYTTLLCHQLVETNGIKNNNKPRKWPNVPTTFYQQFLKEQMPICLKYIELTKIS